MLALSRGRCLMVHTAHSIVPMCHPKLTMVCHITRSGLVGLHLAPPAHGAGASARSASLPMADERRVDGSQSLGSLGHALDLGAAQDAARGAALLSTASHSRSPPAMRAPSLNGSPVGAAQGSLASLPMAQVTYDFEPAHLLQHGGGKPMPPSGAFATGMLLQPHRLPVTASLGRMSQGMRSPRASSRACDGAASNVATPSKHHASAAAVAAAVSAPHSTSSGAVTPPASPDWSRVLCDGIEGISTFSSLQSSPALSHRAVSTHTSPSPGLPLTTTTSIAGVRTAGASPAGAADGGVVATPTASTGGAGTSTELGSEPYIVFNLPIYHRPNRTGLESQRVRNTCKRNQFDASSVDEVEHHSTH